MRFRARRLLWTFLTLARLCSKKRRGKCGRSYMEVVRKTKTIQKTHVDIEGDPSPLGILIFGISSVVLHHLYATNGTAPETIGAHPVGTLRWRFAFDCRLRRTRRHHPLHRSLRVASARPWFILRSITWNFQMETRMGRCEQAKTNKRKTKVPAIRKCNKTKRHLGFD